MYYSYPLLYLIIFFIILILFVWIFLFPRFRLSNILKLKTEDSYKLNFSSSGYKNIKIYIKPEKSRVLCTLSYKMKKEEIIQSKWYSDKDFPETYLLIAEPFSDNYSLKVETEEEQDVFLNIENTMNEKTITPYNSIISRGNSEWIRVVDIVPAFSNYAQDQKSDIIDFGSFIGGNVEIIIQCSNETSPKIQIFGSMEEEENKFSRIVEIDMSDGSFLSLNQKLYVDSVILTDQRYFYIEVSGEEAINLYIKMIRKNF